MTSTCPAGHTSQADDYCDVCGAPIGAAASVGAAPAATSTGSAGSGLTGAGSTGAGAPAGSAGAGSLLDLGPAGAGAGSGDRTCPHCSASNLPSALFCEDCGYDFTTGQLPRADPPPLTAPDGAAVPPPLPTGTPSADAATPSADAADATPAPGVPAAVPPAQQGPVDWVAEIWIDPDWHAAQEVSEPCPSPGMPEIVALRGTSQLGGRRSVSRNIHPQIDCGADTGVSRRHAQLTTDGQRWWVEDLQSSNGTYVGTAGGPLPDSPVAAGQRAELPDDARVYLGAWTRIVVRPATAEERAAAG